jgi:large subunit ribosomal protein L22
VTEGRATARFVRGSAQKAGLVMDLIRGRDVNTALATLRFSRKSVAQDVSKVLRSAIANAQQKDGASGDVDRLFVGSCYANQGPQLKRIRAAPMGRAFRIIKRSSHLTVVVNERAEVVRVPVSAPSEESSTDAPPKVAKKATAKKSRPGGLAKRKPAKKETGTKAKAVEAAKSTDD